MKHYGKFHTFGIASEIALLSIIQVIILKSTVSVNFTINFSDLNPNCGFSDANDLVSPEVPIFRNKTRTLHNSTTRPILKYEYYS